MGKKARRERKQNRPDSDATEARRLPVLKIASIVGVVGGIATTILTRDWEWGITVVVVAIVAGAAWDNFTDPPEAKGGGSSDAINFGN